jgi:hypothetical protein
MPGKTGEIRAQMAEPSCWAIAERDGLSRLYERKFSPAACFCPLGAFFVSKNAHCRLLASRIVGGWGTSDSQKRGRRRARIGLPGW